MIGKVPDKGTRARRELRVDHDGHHVRIVGNPVAAGPGTFADSTTILAFEPVTFPQEAIVAADSALQHPGLYLVKLTPGGLHCGGRVAPLLVRVFQGRQTKSETQRF